MPIEISFTKSFAERLKFAFVQAEADKTPNATARARIVLFMHTFYQTLVWVSTKKGIYSRGIGSGRAKAPSKASGRRKTFSARSQKERRETDGRRP